MDVDLRRLRYFVAVAEELHFGCAADRLHIAQPVLSRQIRVLEGELGVELFSRDRRGTTLTPAGEQLLAGAGDLLVSAEALVRRVRATAEGARRLTIGFMPGITLTPVVRLLRTRYPGLDVRMREGTQRKVPVIHSVEEKLELVAGGEGIAVIPASTADFYTRPGVEVLPIEDLGPNQVAAAWPAARATALVREFAEAAADLLPESPAARARRA